MKKNPGVDFGCVLFIASILAVYCAWYSCKPDKNTGLVVTVVDVSGNKIAGASVRVHCDTLANPGCIIDITRMTDSFGVASFIFQYPAVLTIDAKKNTLKGAGIADLEQGKTITVKVGIK